MGKGARWITRCSAALVLVGTVSSAAGTAFGYSSGGVNVPDTTFRQDTGTQQVTITIGPPLVGTDQTLVIWPFYSSDYHWLVGVTADQGTGASCAYDVGQWQCTPGHAGWRAGDLRVLVNTAKGMDCGLHAGVCQNDEINILGLPDAPDHNGLRDGEPFSVLGHVLIMPDSVPWHGATPAPVYRPPLATASATPSAGTGTGGPGTAAAAASTALASPTDGAASPDPTGSLDAVDTALTSTPSGSSTGRYLALAIPILVGVAAPIAYRMRRRRRAAGGE